MSDKSPDRDLPEVTIVGGGLAGSEAAWQLAQRGIKVRLCEMRPVVPTAAHKTEKFAELVCSNTFKSTETVNAHGLLKVEMRILGSMILECADEARVPAGSALAVDREQFSDLVSAKINAHPNITVDRAEVQSLPSAPAIVATGPLTSDALASSIRERLGVQGLAFYDAIAPIVAIDSIDESIAFRASRYGKETMENEGDGAYINCPLSKEQYEAFIDALIEADQFVGHEFDKVPYFEGCMPIEEMAKRGRETLRFGPLKPVGLTDPNTGKEAHAVIQLRREDKAGQMWNMVGFQTRLRIPEQQRVFRMIPGLQDAEFLRFGSIHRNSYINTPAALAVDLSLPSSVSVTVPANNEGRAAIYFAGQITGVEGYTESTATGLLGAINLFRGLSGLGAKIPPPTTMLGALYRYLNEADPKHFQPMNANFGLLDELPKDGPRIRDKRKKKEMLAERALNHMVEFAESLGIATNNVLVGASEGADVEAASDSRTFNASMAES